MAWCFSTLHPLLTSCLFFSFSSCLCSSVLPRYEHSGRPAHPQQLQPVQPLSMHTIATTVPSARVLLLQAAFLPLPLRLHSRRSTTATATVVAAIVAAQRRGQLLLSGAPSTPWQSFLGTAVVCIAARACRGSHPCLAIATLIYAYPALALSAATRTAVSPLVASSPSTTSSRACWSQWLSGLPSQRASLSPTGSRAP